MAFLASYIIEISTLLLRCNYVLDKVTKCNCNQQHVCIKAKIGLLDIEYISPIC